MLWQPPRLWDRCCDEDAPAHRRRGVQRRRLPVGKGGVRVTVLVRPLSLAYGIGAAARRRLYDLGVFPRGRVEAPVISVGNLGIGGAGKTPLVAAFAGLLQDAGQDVAILSRGYRGRFRGTCHVVSDGKQVLSGPAEAGDEPVMLARALPGVVVAVGRRRLLVAKEVVRRFPGRVLVLDDGFQHLALQRDLDVLAVDDETWKDHPLPEGRLREFASAARRADLLIDFGATPSPRDRAASIGAKRVVRGFFDQRGDEVEPPRRAFLVSAIARPERFEEAVRSQGVAIAGHWRRRDHDAFTAGDVASAVDRTRRTGADAAVTTEKNAVWLDADAATDVPLRIMKIGVVFDDTERVRRILLSAVGPRSAR